MFDEIDFSAVFALFASGDWAGVAVAVGLIGLFILFRKVPALAKAADALGRMVRILKPKPPAAPELPPVEGASKIVGSVSELPPKQ